MAMAASTHILVIPYPAQGHTTPILDLTAQLFLRGLTRITILVTPNNLQTLTPLLTIHPLIKTLVLPFPPHPQIPPGVENIKYLGNASTPAMITALSALQQPVTEWFSTHPSPPTAIISDFFLGHWTQNLALSLRIPRLAFFSSGAFLTCVTSHLFTDMDVEDEDDVQYRKRVEFTNLPNSPVFEWGELPPTYRLYKTAPPIGVMFRDAALANLSSWGCIFNSFQYLEGRQFINGSPLVYINWGIRILVGVNVLIGRGEWKVLIGWKKFKRLIINITRRPREAPVRRVEFWEEERERRGRGRPKQTLNRVVQSDMCLLGLEESMTADQVEWRRKIHVVDCA